MGKIAQRDSLAELEISNGEAAMIESAAHFLNFIKVNLPLPENRKELNRYLARYVKQVRREQMQQISADRVARGLEPLPTRLLL